MKAMIPDQSSATTEPASLAPSAPTIESSANNEDRRSDYPTLIELVYEYQLLEQLCDESISQQEVLTRTLWPKADKNSIKEALDVHYDRVTVIELQRASSLDADEIGTPSADPELTKGASVTKNCQAQQTSARAREDAETLEFQIGLFQTQMQLISEKILSFRPLTTSDVAEKLIHLAAIVRDGEEFDEMRFSDAICGCALTARNALALRKCKDHDTSGLTISNVSPPDN
jgi:hypothetical protein